MTNGERWKVYPLLFLALGIAVKDKLVKVVSTDKMICNTLEITDPQGNKQALLSANPAGGLLQLHGNGNNPSVVLGHTAKLYGLIFVDAKGNLVSPTIAVPAVPFQPGPQEPAPPGNLPPGDQPPTDEPPEVQPPQGEPATEPEPNAS